MTMNDELSTTRLAQVRHELGRVIVGQDRVVDRLLVAVLADGHVLLEGAPGLGKTMLLATLARILGGTFNRIQFTPDLIPSDIVGTRIFRPSTEAFDVEPGPIIANVVLVDEINRAPARVQSALLEAMAERQVTVGGRTFAMPKPFLVVATQNPVESEGVYPLAEAQRDRFLMRIPVDYPTPAEERAIVARMADEPPLAARLLDPADVVELQLAARRVTIDEPTVDYAIRLVLATRDPVAHGLAKQLGLLEYGASPRASLGLVRSARAMALLRGRQQAVAQDVYDVAYDILNARLALSYRATAEGFTIDDVLVELLSTVPAPSPVTWGPPVRTATVAAPTVPSALAPVSPAPSEWQGYQAPTPSASEETVRWIGLAEQPAPQAVATAAPPPQPVQPRITVAGAPTVAGTPAVAPWPTSPTSPTPPIVLPGDPPTAR
jgi:MoxR-like ATPase